MYLVSFLKVFGTTLFGLLITIPIAILWLPCYIYRLLIISIASLNSSYGKVFSFMDTWLEENYSQFMPKTSLVVSMTFDGDLRLEQVRNLFHQNVLKALLPGNSNKLRYPELKQYPVNFMGFWFWKNDDNFHLENHIIEAKSSPVKRSNLALAKIHEEMLNQKYIENRSPWEITLVRDFPETEGQIQTSARKSLLILRIHHVMADAKSIFKMLVECLGEKKMKTAQAKYTERTMMENALLYFIFPLNYAYYSGRSVMLLVTSRLQPWKCSLVSNDDTPQVTAFSVPLSLEKIKSVAKKCSATTSSVVMALVGETLSEFNGTSTSSKNILTPYILPIPEHPSTLTNHASMVLIELPTENEPITNRLQKCNEIFLNLKQSDLLRCTNFFGFQIATMVDPLRKLFTGNLIAPIGITNIAGESEGFSVGGLPCLDMTLSAGTTQGCRGVVFCACSYKENIKVAVVGRSSMFSERDVKNIAARMGTIFEDLCNELLS